MSNNDRAEVPVTAHLHYQECTVLALPARSLIDGLLSLHEEMFGIQKGSVFTKWMFHLDSVPGCTLLLHQLLLLSQESRLSIIRPGPLTPANHLRRQATDSTGG